MAVNSAPSLHWRVAVASLAGVACICGYVCVRSSRRWFRAGCALGRWSSDDLDVPEEYRDPISLTVMEDPVVLCATGQIYDYHTLKQWFMTGSLICPKTNLELTDGQVTRLPWLKELITQWKRNQGLAVNQQSTMIEKLKSIHPQLPTWVEDLKTDMGEKRIHAARHVNDLLCGWKTEVGVCEVCLQKKQLVQTAVMDHMIWLVRYGNTYLQGVAASTLAHCVSEEEVCFLVATALIPMIGLLKSPNNYAKQAASRVLNNVVRSGEKARQIMRDAGAVQSLLDILDTPRVSYGYSRSPAAAALAVLIEDTESREYVREHGLPVLKEVLESSCRYEVRDAAAALLALGMSEAELESKGLNRRHLHTLQWCSEAWLLHQAEQPDEGYTEEEIEAYVEEHPAVRLAALVLMESDEEEAGRANDDAGQILEDPELDADE